MVARALQFVALQACLAPAFLGQACSPITAYKEAPGDRADLVISLDPRLSPPSLAGVFDAVLRGGYPLQISLANENITLAPKIFFILANDPKPVWKHRLFLRVCPAQDAGQGSLLTPVILRADQDGVILVEPR